MSPLEVVFLLLIASVVIAGWVVGRGLRRELGYWSSQIAVLDQRIGFLADRLKREGEAVTRDLGDLRSVALTNIRARIDTGRTQYLELIKTVEELGTRVEWTWKVLGPFEEGDLDHSERIRRLKATVNDLELQVKRSKPGQVDKRMLTLEKDLSETRAVLSKDGQMLHQVITGMEELGRKYMALERDHDSLFKDEGPAVSS